MICNNPFFNLLCLSDHDTSHTQEVGKADRKYCVDENIDRRNHYLDLPGIENYSSKFDDKGMQKLRCIKICIFIKKYLYIYINVYVNLPGLWLSG